MVPPGEGHTAQLLAPPDLRGVPVIEWLVGAPGHLLREGHIVQLVGPPDLRGVPVIM